MQQESIIIWPEEFKPGKSEVFVRNELFIAAPASKIWDCLINAARWHEYYPNASSVKIIAPAGGYLSAGAIFKWKTFGVNLVSEIKEFVPPYRIAWTGKGLGVWVYHAWLITEKDNGCNVLTEESQYGWACVLGNLFMPNRMHKYHQIWLQEIAKRVSK